MIVQRWFPRLHAAYVALSPKHRRRREAAVLIWGRRWVARRDLGAYFGEARDTFVFDALSGRR